MELNIIINQDCIEGMNTLEDNTVDLIIADPPYNLSKGGEWKWDNSVKLAGMGGNWNKVMESWDNMSLSEYFTFTITWLTEAQRILTNWLYVDFWYISQHRNYKCSLSTS